MMIENLIQKFLALPTPTQATVLLLVLVGIQQFNQGHIGRVGIASAGVLIFTKAYPIWGDLADIWQLYTIAAVAFAAIAGPSYVTKTSLPTAFYKLALFLYGGVPILMVWLYGFPL